MRLGVYVAAGPNPIFLRAFMMQIARQTRLPDVISIFENGNKTSAFNWCCKDVLTQLKDSGVTIIHYHDPEVATSAKRYFVPLKTLYLHDCGGGNGVDLILKMDLDDFYEDRYIENMVNLFKPGYNLGINQNNGLVLVRPFHGDFKYKEKVVMSKSPIKSAPSHVIFDREFANVYIGYLSYHAQNPNSDAQDDELMAEAIDKEKLKVWREDGPVDYMYVSHGTNHSSWSWQSTGGKVYFD